MLTVIVVGLQIRSRIRESPLSNQEFCFLDLFMDLRIDNIYSIFPYAALVCCLTRVLDRLFFWNDCNTFVEWPHLFWKPHACFSPIFSYPRVTICRNWGKVQLSHESLLMLVLFLFIKLCQGSCLSCSDEIRTWWFKSRDICWSACFRLLDITSGVMYLYFIFSHDFFPWPYLGYYIFMHANHLFCSDCFKVVCVNKIKA